MHVAFEIDRQALAHHRYWFMWWTLLLCTPITAGITFLCWLWWLVNGKESARRWADRYGAVLAENRLTVTVGTDKWNSKSVPLDQVTRVTLSESSIGGCPILTLEFKELGRSLEVLALREPVKAQELILNAREASLRG